MTTVIFDIDGTLANCDHRVHHLATRDWDAFYAAMSDDPCHEHVVELARALFHSGWDIIACTGRPDNYRRETGLWLMDHFVPHAKLYMRKAGDRRPDTIVKKELLAEMRRDGYNPVMAIEDRASVVKM